jgi:hypothetical protein
MCQSSLLPRLLQMRMLYNLVGFVICHFLVLPQDPMTTVEMLEELEDPDNFISRDFTIVKLLGKLAMQVGVLCTAAQQLPLSPDVTASAANKNLHIMQALLQQPHSISPDGYAVNRW